MHPTKQRTLEFIRSYSEQHGYAPSLREIMEATGIKSVSHAAHTVRGLAEDGHIRLTKRISRGIVVQ